MDVSNDLQIVPSCSLDSDTINDTSPAQSMDRYPISPEGDHAPSLKRVHQEIDMQYTGNTPLPMQCLTEGDTVEQSSGELLERGYSNKMAEVPDEQNRRNRNSTTSNSSNDDQNVPSHVIIDRKIIFFPDKCANLSRFWYLYRIDIAGNSRLGFIVPCQLPKLPKFDLYKNEEALEVQVNFLSQIDYSQCGHQLESFCQYLFEEVFDGMHTGSSSTLKFDLKHSNFQLLPCLLNESGELDYQEMTLVCDRKNKLIQKPSDVNDHGLFIRVDLPSKRFYTGASVSQKKLPRVSIQHIEKPNIDYLKKSSPSNNKKQKTTSPKIEACSIEALHHAPLNQTDLELIYKLPSALVRISQLYHIEQLKKLLADHNHPTSVTDAHQMSTVTFGDYLLEILSSDQSDSLPFISPNYDLLSPYNRSLQLPSDLLFQSITRRSADEKTNMESLEILGDCFLKFVVSKSLYQRYPFDDIGDLTKKRNEQVSNSNLSRIAMEKGLQHYLNTTKVIFCGDNANWIPPGYKIDEENSKRYLEQEVKSKALADMIEAVIGAVLVYAGYSAAIEFMKWLGLDVISIDEHNVIELPSVLRIKEPINEIKIGIHDDYHKRSFTDIETKIDHTFADKAYLMAAFTHPSCSCSVNTINYRRLKYVGNPLLEFLIKRYPFVKKKSITPGHITNVQQDLLNNRSKAAIMVANELHGKIICVSQKPINSGTSNTTDKDFSTDEENTTQRADVLEALIAAVFFDSACSLKIVWNTTRRLLRQYIDLDSVAEMPTLNTVRSVHESGGIITDGPIDGNGNFVCQLKLPDGTRAEGSGKSKRLAQQEACKKVRA